MYMFTYITSATTFLCMKQRSISLSVFTHHKDSHRCVRAAQRAASEESVWKSPSSVCPSSVSLWQPIWCALIRKTAAAGMSLTEELVLKRSKARSLEAVRNLNCWGCGLSDVSILARIPNLEVLNIRWVWHYICIHILQYWYNFYGHFNISVATTWQA